MVSSSSSVVKVKLGQWGEAAAEAKGRQWDDGGGYTGIRSITVGYGVSGGVETIQVEYDLFGDSVLGQEHGTDNMALWELRVTQTKKHKLVVDFPDEFLTGVYLYEEMSEKKINGGRRIHSLKLRTNRRVLSATAAADGNSSGKLQLQCSVEGGSADEAAIVGFFGRSSWYRLRSLGVYLAVLCPTAGDLLDKLHHQGLMPYRTSPLSMPSINMSN